MVEALLQNHTGGGGWIIVGLQPSVTIYQANREASSVSHQKSAHSIHLPCAFDCWPCYQRSLGPHVNDAGFQLSFVYIHIYIYLHFTQDNQPCPLALSTCQGPSLVPSPEFDCLQYAKRASDLKLEVEKAWKR